MKVIDPVRMSPAEHVPIPGELRRAHAALRRAENLLELAALDGYVRVVREIRHQVWSRLVEVERNGDRRP